MKLSTLMRVVSKLVSQFFAAVVTVARVKDLIVYSKDARSKLIKFTDVPPGSHTEETFEDIEEAELDEAWDLDLRVTATVVSRLSLDPRKII